MRGGRGRRRDANGSGISPTWNIERATGIRERKFRWRNSSRGRRRGEHQKSTARKSGGEGGAFGVNILLRSRRALGGRRTDAFFAVALIRELVFNA